mgnify:CR=1 FL=1
MLPTCDQYMETIRQTVVENLKQLAHAPSVQMQEIVKSVYMGKAGMNEGDPDVRDSVTDKERRSVRSHVP